MPDETALFIDFENIRYSMINVQHREPDPQELIALARRFGTVMVARAYADWSRQPEFFKGSLTAAMIDRVDCPAKVRERFRQNNGFYGQPDRFQPRDAREDEYPLDEQDELDETETYADDATGEGDEPLDGEFDARAADDEPYEGAADEDRRPRGDVPFANQNGGLYVPHHQNLITQSTVDLNMLMEIIETVFDRPSINTFILMSGDRDFTRICARLKLRLNKRVIVAGVPGTVSRDLISAAEQFIPLGFSNAPYTPHRMPQHVTHQPQFAASGPVQPDEPGFIQFLDYIDKHWSWRTVSGVANFIGDTYNPKNRFRGRLTRDSARDLLRICIEDGILFQTADPVNGENLRLNREHPAVLTVLSETMIRG